MKNTSESTKKNSEAVWVKLESVGYLLKTLEEKELEISRLKSHVQVQNTKIQEIERRFENQKKGRHEVWLKLDAIKSTIVQNFGHRAIKRFVSNTLLHDVSGYFEIGITYDSNQFCRTGSDS